MQKNKFTTQLLWTCVPILVATAYFFGPDFQNWVGQPNSGNAPHFAKSSLLLEKSGGKTIPLDVEVAKTPQEHSYGLMFRKSLPHTAGMIFIEEQDQVATFWMENTLIPLDMIFINRIGVITKIVRNARPLDLSPISSDAPVRGILEINGGDAEKMDLREGDRVIFSAFSDTP